MENQIRGLRKAGIIAITGLAGLVGLTGISGCTENSNISSRQEYIIVKKGEKDYVRDKKGNEYIIGIEADGERYFGKEGVKYVEFNDKWYVDETEGKSTKEQINNLIKSLSEGLRQRISVGK